MPDGNTPEHRTILTCVDVIIGTHTRADGVQQRAQPLRRAQLLRAQAEFIDELTGRGQGGAG
jgi:hypothetical protein